VPARRHLQFEPERGTLPMAFLTRFPSPRCTHGFEKESGPARRVAVRVGKLPRPLRLPVRTGSPPRPGRRSRDRRPRACLGEPPPRRDLRRALRRDHPRLRGPGALPALQDSRSEDLDPDGRDDADLGADLLRQYAEPHRAAHSPQEPGDRGGPGAGPGGGPGDALPAAPQLRPRHQPDLLGVVAVSNRYPRHAIGLHPTLAGGPALLRRRRLRDQFARHAPPAAFAAMAHGELADLGGGGDAVLQLLSADLGRARTRRGPARRAPGPHVIRYRNRGDRVTAAQANRHDPVCHPCAGVLGRGARARAALAV
jgi:hypothetical protein